MTKNVPCYLNTKWNSLFGMAKQILQLVSQLILYVFSKVTGVNYTLWGLKHLFSLNGCVMGAHYFAILSKNIYFRWTTETSEFVCTFCTRWFCWKYELLKSYWTLSIGRDKSEFLCTRWFCWQYEQLKSYSTLSIGTATVICIQNKFQAVVFFAAAYGYS